ncbi:MAG: hypothetical protein AAFP04_00900 [Myxococcota bacterium]
MDRHAEFQLLIEILKSLVDQRGGDASVVEREYRWPILTSPSSPSPAEVVPQARALGTLSAISVSPLLTGSID